MNEIIITLVNILNGLASAQGGNIVDFFINFGGALIAVIEAIFGLF